MTLNRILIWLLRIAAIVELATLGALLANLMVVRDPSFAPIVGPIHGIAYVLIIIGNLLSPRSARSRWLSLIPGIGGLLSNWRDRRPHRGTGEAVR